MANQETPRVDVDMILTLHRKECRAWQESRQRCATCIILEARGRLESRKTGHMSPKEH